ncbi:unnamed protein product [Caenorhabditis brenneri]
MDEKNEEKSYDPKDRMRKHAKRKSASRSLYNISEAPAVTSADLDQESNTESCPVPVNPFKISSPQKKRRNCQVTFSIDSDDAQDSFGANIPKSPEKQKSPSKPLRTSPRKKKNPQFERVKSFDPRMLQEFHAVDFSHLCDSSSSFSSQKAAEPTVEKSSELPLDLRLGTKLRIVSKVPLPWMSTRKSTGIVAVRIPAPDRWEGLKYYNKIFVNGQEDPTITPPSSVMALLEASTLYYQFPVVPGMALYPRITSELRNVIRVPMAPPVTNAMFNQWIECYEQLFMSYKKGERDSFYVASAAFNVFFTKTSAWDDEDIDASLGADDSQSCFQSFQGQKLIAVISHTTSSTREHLRNHSVDYTVIGASKTPLKRMSGSFSLDQTTATVDCFMTDSTENSMMGPPESTEKSGETAMESPEKLKDGDESDENDSPTKSNNQWLKNIGVSPRQINKGNVRRKLSSHVADREGVSSLLVKGPAIQSLYNALMTSDIVHEKTGPYTKIPPTLIASSPFLYGQLLSLNKSSQVIARPGTKNSEYVLELDGGPILSYCTQMITRFIRTAKLCRNDEEKTVSLQVTDRHTNQGMSDWHKRATNWSTVTIHEDCVKWTKI